MSKKEKYCRDCSGAKTEFEKEIADFAYFIAKQHWMPELIISRNWINKLLSIAKKELFEDMPKWKKTNVSGTGVYEIVGQEPICLYYNGYRIEMSDLEKLPKED